MKELLPHIFIEKDKAGRANLIIEDYELCDFVEDYLTESCEISYEGKSISKSVTGEIVRLTFSALVEIEEIESFILKLSMEEVTKFIC